MFFRSVYSEAFSPSNTHFPQDISLLLFYLCIFIWNAATVWQFGLCLHEPVLPGLGHSRLSAGCCLIVTGFLHCKPGTSGSILLGQWQQNRVEPAAAGSLGHAFAWAWGIRFFLFLKELMETVCWRPPRGSVILKEVSRLGDWLTQPSPALGELTLPGGGCLSCHWAALVFIQSPPE